MDPTFSEGKGLNHMAGTSTSTFIHVEEMQVGPATIVDGEGATSGLALVVYGEDNETGDDVIFTLSIPADIATAIHGMVGCVLRSEPPSLINDAG